MLRKQLGLPEPPAEMAGGDDAASPSATDRRGPALRSDADPAAARDRSAGVARATSQPRPTQTGPQSVSESSARQTPAGDSSARRRQRPSAEGVVRRRKR